MEFNKKNIRIVMCLIVFAGLVLTLAQNTGRLIEFFGDILNMFTPVFIGLALAFVLNIFMKIFEERLFVNLKKSKTKSLHSLVRPLSLIATIALVPLIISIVALVIVPEIMNLFVMLKNSLPGWLEYVGTIINDIIVKYDLDISIIENIDIDWKSSPKAYAAELKRLAGNYSDLCDKARESEQNLKIGQTNYDALKVVIGQIATAMPEWADVKAVNKVSMVGALQKANAVLAECNTYREQLAEKVREIVECDGLIKEYLESQDSVDKDRLIVLSALNVAQIAKINEGLEQTRASIVAATSALDEHNKTYKDLQERRPDITEEDTQESLKADLSVCADEIGELRESKGAAEQKLIQIAEQQKKQGEYENEFAILQADYDKWARLCAYFGDSKGAKFRKIARATSLPTLSVRPIFICRL